MKTARITISPASLLFYMASTMAAFVAAGLTLMFWLESDEDMLPLLYPLFPGVIVGLLITGGHGGTATEQRVAAVVAAIVNAIVYFLIIFAIRFLWRLCFCNKNFVAPTNENPPRDHL